MSDDTSAEDPEFYNPPIIILFYRVGYSFTFLLGFLSNTASLATFSRPKLRKVSTGCLFMVLAISDLLYLFMCVFDYLEFGFQVSFIDHVDYSPFCRFRAFVMNVAQMSSAWVLVFVSLDRWIRTRFPFKSGSICTPKKALMAVGILLIVEVPIHSHLLVPMFGMLVPGFANAACGPDFIDEQYLTFYFMQWSIIQIFTSCLIPAFLMSLILIDIFINVRVRKRALAQTTTAWVDGANARGQKNFQNQMLILMVASVGIFLITTLPFAIGKILLPKQGDFVADAVRLSIIWTELGWFQSLNYAINFYVHCLSSKLFRKEFEHRLKGICLKRPNQVDGGEGSNTGPWRITRQL